MIIGSIAKAALSALPSSVTQSLPFQFLTDPLGTTLGGLAKTFIGSAAHLRYARELAQQPGGSPVRLGLGLSRGRDVSSGELLSGGHVPGGLLRVSGTDFFYGSARSVAGVQRPGRRNLPP